MKGATATAMANNNTSTGQVAQEKIRMTFYLDKEKAKRFKIIAIEEDKDFSELGDEALDLLISQRRRR